MNAPLDKWKKSRDEMRTAIETKGYDADRGVFVQAFDHPVMDASLLLLPTVDFVDYRDDANDPHNGCHTRGA